MLMPDSKDVIFDIKKVRAERHLTILRLYKIHRSEKDGALIKSDDSFSELRRKKQFFPSSFGR